MNDKAKYDDLRREIEAIEQACSKTLGQTVYLTDENIDVENVIDAGFEYGTDAFWSRMLLEIGPNAGARAEELGLNINALLGRVIY